MEKIKEAQSGHPSIEGIKRKLSMGKASEFVIDNEGILWYGERLCVPNIEDLKQQVLTEAHTTHIRSTLEEPKCIRIFRKDFGGTV